MKKLLFICFLITSISIYAESKITFKGSFFLEPISFDTAIVFRYCNIWNIFIGFFQIIFKEWIFFSVFFY